MDSFRKSHMKLPSIIIPTDPQSHSASSSSNTSSSSSSPADSDLHTPFHDQPLQSLSTVIPSKPVSTTRDIALFMDRRQLKRTLSGGSAEQKSGATNVNDNLVSSECSSPPLSVMTNRAYTGLTSLFRKLSSGRSLSMVEYHRKTSSSSEALMINTTGLKSSYPAPSTPLQTNGRCYSFHFPEVHHLNPNFVQRYKLQDELGSGGYGFVMTAHDVVAQCEVAVKFIIKDKVPEHAWMEDEELGRLPTEVVILSAIRHDNIVESLDLYEDELYFYLVQELHGSPWHQQHRLNVDISPSLSCNPSNSQSISTPLLSPSASESSLSTSVPGTPPPAFPTRAPQITKNGNISTASPDAEIPKLLHEQLSIAQQEERSVVTRRASHDLFECIEQSADKRLTEPQARYVFSQVVDAVFYLESLGITHRDIKDENLVIDKDLKVKLIDFGSAIMVDPTQSRPSYKVFYGTAAYASSEILLKKDYQAAPAEIWTLGVLLSYLLVGVSPFPSARDAVEGNIFLSEKHIGEFSPDAMDLMCRCLDPNPDTRATIHEVKHHEWLTSHSSQS